MTHPVDPTSPLDALIRSAGIRSDRELARIGGPTVHAPRRVRRGERILRPTMRRLAEAIGVPESVVRAVVDASLAGAEARRKSR